MVLNTINADIYDCFLLPEIAFVHGNRNNEVNCAFRAGLIHPARTGAVCIQQLVSSANFHSRIEHLSLSLGINLNLDLSIDMYIVDFFSLFDGTIDQCKSNLECLPLDSSVRMMERWCHLLFIILNNFFASSYEKMVSLKKLTFRLNRR